MRTFTLDASEWNAPPDFYESILAVLEAPYWHGVNMYALIGSMFYGGVNGVDPPYRIWIRGTGNLPDAVKTEIGWFAQAVLDYGGIEKGIVLQIDT
jgi:hypothetical protein